MKKSLSLFLCTAFAICTTAAPKQISLTSPDGKILVKINSGEKITYAVSMEGTCILAPSEISMTLDNMDAKVVYGKEQPAPKISTRSVDQTLNTVIYKKAKVRDHYNELTLSYKEFSVIFRAFNEGVAYRFVSKSKTDFLVMGEKAEFLFPEDWQAYVPYVRDFTNTFEDQFYNSFENTYEHIKLSKWDARRMAFLPLVVEAAGYKVCITEADLLHYPGMYLHNANASTTLKAVFAPYPKKVTQGGHNMLQGEVQSRQNYIAKASAGEKFPWRIVIIAKEDKDLTDNDMVYCLASAPKPGTDWSWVKPGKVAWDWWNSWNLYGVDFETGVNNDTYKYYIDFAAQKGLEYVILDEGWSVNKAADLMQVVPEIDLPALSAYAQSKGVGLVLWAGYWAFDRDMEKICKHYSEMGIKGFKIDFMDRDDQQMVDFYIKAAQTAAKYKMFVDFHGAFKPTGLCRTYPNVINYEGVHGLEQMKWSSAEVDQVTYDVTIPFIRMVAGPFDYTQGAMRNATKQNYHPINSEAMSQGTRCRQLAEFVIFDAPFSMLCDSPSNYIAEEECTKFISDIPTVWDETFAIDGKIAEYVAMGRRKGNTWYVGALTNWDARDLTLDLSFLPEGNYTVEIYKDGINADKAARDFKLTSEDMSKPANISLHMAPGGGWVAKFVKK